MKIYYVSKGNLLHAVVGTKHRACYMGVAKIKTLYILVEIQPQIQIRTIRITLVSQNIHLSLGSRNIIILSSTSQREIQKNSIISHEVKKE